MIADAPPIFDTAWWFMLFPGIALLITVLAFNLVGDGLQDALDPRSDQQMSPSTHGRTQQPERHMQCQGCPGPLALVAARRAAVVLAA